MSHSTHSSGCKKSCKQKKLGHATYGRLVNGVVVVSNGVHWPKSWEGKYPYCDHHNDDHDNNEEHCNICGHKNEGHECEEQCNNSDQRRDKHQHEEHGEHEKSSSCCGRRVEV